jgi:DNA-binding NarL/FixJ family response regulator
VTAPIRVAVLDDHAAVRAGLAAILGSAPDMVFVGSAHGESELHWLLQRTDPSVLILDVHHPGLHSR